MAHAARSVVGRRARARARGRRRGAGATTSPARTSATRATFLDLGRCAPRSTGCGAKSRHRPRPGAAIGSSCSSTSSILTSRSTRRRHGRTVTTTSPTPGRIPFSSGRRMPRTRDEAGLTEREARHLRANYGAKLSMIDSWLGRLVDTLDEHALWDDTAVIVCTDHGHYLGERGIWGKPAVPLYGPMMHLPLLVCWPGLPPERQGSTVDALTTSVDIHATIADVFDVADEVEHRTHGRSLVPLLEGQRTAVRQWALAGVWGREVQVVGDRGAIRYSRAPTGDNAPLAMWSNRWSTMPVHAFPQIAAPASRQAGCARHHARLRCAGDPPAVRRERSTAVLGNAPLHRQSPLRRRATIRSRSATSPAAPRRARRSTSSSPPSTKSKHRREQRVRLGLA